MKTGITFGTFDLLHAGHCMMFTEAKKHCDYLIVGLQTDPTIDRPNKHKPIQSLFERYIQLNANRNVDKVIVYETEYDLVMFLRELKPDVRIIGEDWKDKLFTGHEEPIKIIFNTRNHPYSSSYLRDRITNNI